MGSAAQLQLSGETILEVCLGLSPDAPLWTSKLGWHNTGLGNLSGTKKRQVLFAQPSQTHRGIDREHRVSGDK